MKHVYTRWIGIAIQAIYLATIVSSLVCLYWLDEIRLEPFRYVGFWKVVWPLKRSFSDHDSGGWKIQFGVRNHSPFLRRSLSRFSDFWILAKRTALKCMFCGNTEVWSHWHSCWVLVSRHNKGGQNRRPLVATFPTFWWWASSLPYLSPRCGTAPSGHIRPQWLLRRRDRPAWTWPARCMSIDFFVRLGLATHHHGRPLSSRSPSQNASLFFDDGGPL